jgi:UDP-galactopyranose mutase
MIIVAGAGISGSVIAQQFATRLNERVLVIEKRSSIGGNCSDYVDSNGILVPLYGPHFFHTKVKEVWEYVKEFSDWRPYEHRVLSYVDGKYVPVPVNMRTVNELFGLNLTEPAQMESWLELQVERFESPKNSEEAALSRVGRILYEKMFKNYTKKQWDRDPSDLDPQVMNRIPVRISFDDRYFDDPYQAMPVEGYTNMIGRMLSHPNIEVRLNVDYFDICKSLPKRDLLFFTGRIDQYFQRSFKKSLQYRSLRFEYETIDKEFALPATTVNFPNDHEFTRMTEPKRAMSVRREKTVVVREYPTWNGEPFYPVLDGKNEKVFHAFQELANRTVAEGVHFVGRLANYRYFNMDQAVKNALDIVQAIIDTREKRA